MIKVAQNRAPPEDLSPDVTQRRASEPNTSVWVNASAGSGKTTILTKRVLRLLLGGVKPEKILCLTYTRAAAAEMAIRVTEKLSEWATCGEDTLGQSIADLQDRPADPRQKMEARRLFARVLSCPGGMRIRTLHAFCQEILRRFPIEAGLAPHFAVIEERAAHALQEDVQTEVLREIGREPDGKLGQALKSLIGSLGEKGFGESMRALLSDRVRFLNATEREGSLEKLINRVRTHLSLAAGETSENLICRAVEDTAFDVIQVRQAAAWLSEGSSRYATRGKTMLTWLALTSTERALQFDVYYGCFFTQKDEPFSEMANKDLVVKFPNLTPILQQEIARLTLLSEQLEAAHIAENTAAILTCGYELIQRYEMRKKAQAVLEYDDLIVRTDRLLHRAGLAPWILYKLDGGIDHILVDEAQDTSQAQWNIVSALADEFFAGSSAQSDVERTLFVVGDEKQSIFSFQRADPEAFTHMRDYFAERIKDAEKLYDEVPLRISFRSAPAILQTVDAVFESADVWTGVAARPLQHFPSRPRAGEHEKIGRVEVWKLQESAEAGEDDKESWAPSKYEMEHDPQAELAAKIADKIKNWLKNHTILPGAKAPVTPGDIMILLRRRGRFADLMVRALKQQEVPVTGVDRMCLVKQLPVMDLLAVMQFALLPEDDLNLATVLRGPLLNLSEDQLMALALGRESTLWQSLCEKAVRDAAYKAAHNYLLQWLNAADFQSPLSLLTKILNEPCPGSTISGRRAIWARLGLDALDPVEELLNAAQDFSHRHVPSLQNFLHWLMATEAEIKRELDRREKDHDGGQVRIMTVHASKGLEAPIVFLPDAASPPRMQDVANLLWNDEDLPFYVSGRPMRGPVQPLWQIARRKQMEEYRRLLYVALTRAASHLYIGGWKAKQSNSAESWYTVICNGMKRLDEPSARADDDSVLIARVDPLLKAPAPSIPQAKTALRTTLPGWVRRAAPEEAEALRRVAASRFIHEPPAATPDRAFHRGRIIHRLLQSLPGVEDAQRDKMASTFLANLQHGLTAGQQEDIKQEVLAGVLRNPQFAPLFAPGSRAEVPLVGRIDGEEITGQVDRLCLHENEVWVVDYKTNRPPPKEAGDIPEAYRLQLANYRSVLKEIYPGRTIRCFLLWTYGAFLMPVPEGLLGP